MVETGIHVVDFADVCIQMFLYSFKLVAVCANKADLANFATASQVKHRQCNNTDLPPVCDLNGFALKRCAAFGGSNKPFYQTWRLHR